MRKSIPAIACVSLLAIVSLNAAARGGGGGGGFSHGTATGPSSGSEAFSNSNGRFAQDRDTGLDRAKDRMSQRGLDHEQATDAQKKRNARSKGTGPALHTQPANQ